MSTAKELAAMLNGREYGDEVTDEVAKLAKDAGLVIVHGASDDLIEFRGAIVDEASCYGGGEVGIDEAGLIPDRDQIDHDDDELRKYFKRIDRKHATIKAIWNKDGYSWKYETTIPHETFEIMEGDEKYCRGIVFKLKDA